MFRIDKNIWANGNVENLNFKIQKQNREIVWVAFKIIEVFYDFLVLKVTKILDFKVNDV